MRPSLLQSRNLMFLQAYIDDSHDDVAGTYVLAGYIASVENWAAFSAEWERLLPLTTKNKQGVHRFKMSEMNMRGRMSDVPIFHATIMRHAEMAVACIINKKVLRESVDNLVATIDWPAWGTLEIEIDQLKAKWRDPFYFAFRALMDGFHVEMHKGSEFIKFDGPVDFYFDREEANENYIRTIWQDYINHRPDEHKTLYGRTPRFEKEEEFLPLQAADFRAWWVRKWATDLGAENAMKGTYPFGLASGRTIPGLFFTADAEQIKRTVSEAIGNGITEGFKLGLKPSVKPSLKSRYWPRDKPL